MTKLEEKNVTLVTLGNSYSSLRLSENSKNILDAVNHSPTPITPLEIAEITKIKHSTVKKALGRLVLKGYIQKICYGFYANQKYNDTLKSSMVTGATFVVCRLHCLRLKALGLEGESVKRRRELGPVRVTVQRFGNGTGLVFVDCLDDYSLDYPAFRLLIDAIKSDLDFIGVQDWRGLWVINFEFNNDLQAIRLDGVQAVTVKAFDGSFRRMYNKAFGLRDECKVVGSRRVEDVLALMQGGVSVYTTQQFLFQSLQQLDVQAELLRTLTNQNKKLIEELFKRRDRQGSARLLRAFKRVTLDGET